MRRTTRQPALLAALLAALTFAGLPGIGPSTASAALADGTLQITSPTEGAQLTRNAPVDIQLALSSDLEPGTYTALITQDTGTQISSQDFILTAEHIASGEYTLTGVLFPFVGTYTLRVLRFDPDEPPRRFDDVTVAVVSDQAPTPWGWITPGDGSQVQVGFTGPVTVRLRNAPAGPYRLTIQDTISRTNPNDYWWTKAIQHDGSPDKTYTFRPPAFPVAEQYYLYVEDGAGDFYIESAIDAIQTVRVDAEADQYLDPADFYPLVRDRFRDSTNIAYRLNMPARVRVEVLDADGRVVRREDLGNRDGRRLQWRWDGRNNVGDTVGVGRYRIRLTATDSNGYNGTLTRAVKVVTDTVTRSGRLSRNGKQTSSRSRSSSCYVDPYYDGSLSLDCWGGKYAQATWAFRVPRNATNLQLRFRGEEGCCGNGRITRTGTRVNATTYRALFKVTGWRAYTVESVHLTYKHRVRR
jgi:hypothetical protein